MPCQEYESVVATLTRASHKFLAGQDWSSRRLEACSFNNNPSYSLNTRNISGRKNPFGSRKNQSLTTYFFSM
jgi:hypothetical protein